MNMHATAFAPVAPTPAEIPAGDLSSRAMLADLSIAMWGARKGDKVASADVNARANARDAARVSKFLVSPEAIAPVKRAAASARAIHYESTLPWATDGSRILPVAMHESYSERMREAREAFESAASAFVAEYESHVAAARDLLGDLFNESDYPAPHKVADRFRFTSRVFPVPDNRDWRVDVSAETAARIREDLESSLRDVTAAAVRDCYERVADVVGRMAERLAEYRPAGPDGKAQGVFRDSLVENVRELAAVLPSLNIMGDPGLDAMADRLADLSRVDAADLRTDPVARESTQREAAAIAESVRDFLA